VPGGAWLLGGGLDTISGGKGGSGGGVWLLCEVCDGRRGCRATAGGSFAKTSVKTVMKSWRVDLFQNPAHPARYG
jgi:hypothetical protein